MINFEDFVVVTPFKRHLKAVKKSKLSRPILLLGIYNQLALCKISVNSVQYSFCVI